MRTGKNMILGILFLLIGISILLKAVFHIDIPVFRTAVALFIIYIGVKMLFGGCWGKSCEWDSSNSAAFQSKDWKWDATKNENHFSLAFGSTNIDLTDLELKNDGQTIHVNIAFGDATVYLSTKVPVKIRTSAVFGEARMPDDSTVAFGSQNFTSPGASEKPVVIHGNVAFGSLKFQYKD